MHNNEKSIPHQRGRNQILKTKRLSNKRVRKEKYIVDRATIRKIQKSIVIDK